MTDKDNNSSILRYISVALLAGLFIWQAFIAYIAHDMSELIADFESSAEAAGFITMLSPFIWFFMLTTLTATYITYKRNEFLVIHSILFIVIIALANIFLSITATLSGYQPIFELGSK